MAHLPPPDTHPAAGAAHLNLLGAPRAIIDGQAVELVPRVAILLTLVVLGGPLERGRAAALLYPGADPAVARRNLRQTLHQQHAVFSRLIEADSEHLRLHPAALVDVLALARPEPPHADDAPPPMAPLLGELRFDDRPDFQGWLDGQRQRVRQQQLDRLAGLAGACERAGQLARSLQLAEQLLGADAASEHAHRRLMRLHYLRGDRAAALAAFDRCERVLKDELSVHPAAETLDLLRMIDAAEVMATPGANRRRPLPVTLLRPPFSIGRDTARAALDAAWAGGLAFLVQGEAGIGKSRLLEDHAARHPGTLLVRARHGDARRPYATLARLLQELPGRDSLAPAERDLLTLLRSGSVQAGLHDEHASTESIRATVAAALAHSRVQPLLDDLHLADAATLELLALLAVESPPEGPRWGFATRPHEVPAVLELRRALEDRGRLSVCLLRPLDAPQVTALLDSLQLPAPRVAGLAPMLSRRGGGNPMFMLELLKDWFNQGDCTDPDQVPVPQTIALLLDQQIGACSPRAAALARLAALAATDFCIELAEAVLGETVLALADAWRELEQRHLMRDGVFAHDLIHEAAARSVPPAIALTIHSRIADWLASHGGSPASLATHWLAAGRAAQAVEPLCQAARQAIAAGCIREAGQRYEQAAEILQRQGDADAAFERYFDACEMYVNGAAIAAYDAAAAQAMPLARTPLQQVRAGLIQAFGMYVHGNLAGCATLFAPLLDEAIAVGERRTEAECRLELGRLLLHEGRPRECLRMVAPAAAIFHELGLPARELVARATTSNLVARAGLENITRPMPLAAPDAPRRDQLDGLDRRRKDIAEWVVPARIAANAGEFDRASTLIDEVIDDIATLEMLPSDLFGGSATALGTLVDLGRYGQAIELLRGLDARNDPYRGEWWHEVQAERAALWHALGRPEQCAATPHQRTALPVGSHQARLRLALLSTAPPPLRGARSPWASSPVAAPDLRAGAPMPLRYQPTEENLQLRVRSALALLGAEPAGAALDELRRLDAKLRSTGFHAWRPALQALQALCLAELGDGTNAEWNALADQSEQSLTRLAMPATITQACTWLARAHQCARDVPGAARIARWGRDWLMDEALPRVPPLFHASFLQRNPVHRELLALAQQS